MALQPSQQPPPKIPFDLKAVVEAMQRSAVTVAAKTEDDKDKAEIRASMDKAMLKRHLAETQAVVQSNVDMKVNRRMRWDYAKLVFCYLSLYSVFVGFILLWGGLGWFGFNISESVLQFLVGSTAASSIGLVYSVVTGLFHPKK